MSKFVQIKIFNDLLDQLFNYLETNFKECRSDLVLFKTSIEFIKKSNPRLVVEEFMVAVMPYSDHIFNCNEKFFLDFEKNLSDVSSMDGLKIKKIWLEKSTTDENKAYLWLYFQKLLKAGQKVIS
jgi:hypothetical protein